MPNFNAHKHRRLIWLLIPASLLSGCTNHKQYPQNALLQPKQAQGPESPLAKTEEVGASVPPTMATLEPSNSKFDSGLPERPWVQIGSYRALQALPTEAQKNILKVVIQITLPDEVKSIRSAVSYLLANSGYEFALPTDKNAVAELLTKPVPAVHRHLGPMTLQTALETLAGDSFKLTIDPIHRRLSYKLLPVVQEGGQPL